MEYFEKYTSNTLAGSGNQYIFENDDDVSIYKGRVYYKIFVGGRRKYSLLFSNIIDTTYSDGSHSHSGLVCDEWHIERMRVGVVEKCGANDAVEPQNFIDMTFDGKSKKRVMPGEFFTTDEFEIAPDDGNYVCIEIEYRGKMIPYHEESIIPTFLFCDGKWIPSKRVPFVGMLGCLRNTVKKIAFLGDSITQGIGTENNSYSHYSARLAEMLGRDNAYWNLGLGYARASDAASDGAWLFKAKQNDAVFVCLGVNDLFHGNCMAEKTANDIKTIVLKLKKCGIKVILQTVPPFDYSGETKEKWLKINEYIKTELSSVADYVFDNVPILGGGEERPELAIYGGHPNAEGCLMWARGLFEFIKSNGVL